MMEAHLHKIKLLFNLAAKAPEHEAANAKALAQKLIDKHGVTEDQLNELLNDGKPLYGEDQRLFSTSTVVPWKSLLAYLVSFKFNCYVVQEEQVPTEGTSVFVYYLYGDDNDVAVVQAFFPRLMKEVEDIMNIACYGRGESFIESYREGLINGLRENLAYFDMDFSFLKNKTTDKQLNTSSANLAKTDAELPKEKPAKESVDVSSKTIVKDIAAFFRGDNDGRNVDLYGLFSDEELEAHVAGELDEKS